MYNKPKICYSKIVNPITGRKVNVFGKIGQQVLQYYALHMSSSACVHLSIVSS